MIIWDPLLRIFHWTLALFFTVAYVLEGQWLGLHSHAGYTVALLVLFRLLWGVIGPPSARFSGFVATPADALAHMKALLHGHASAYAGHDPAGAMMVLVLLTSLLVTVLSGMTLFALEGSGPLANTFAAAWSGPLVADIHQFSADFTLCMVMVHIAGVIAASLLQRENLIRAMLTGRKLTGRKLTGRKLTGKKLTGKRLKDS